MTTARWVLWSVGGCLFAAGYISQLVRWLRVLQREGYRGRAVVAFYRRWAFLTSASATAVSHSRNFTSMLFRTPFQAISTRASSAGSRGQDYRTDSRDRKTQRAVSLPIVVLALVGLSVWTRAYVITFFILTQYALFFPWGMPFRGRSGPLVWTLRTRAVAATATVVLAVTSALLWPYVSPLIVGVIDLAALPFVIAMSAPIAHPIGRRVRRAAMAAGRAALDRAAPRVVVITGTYAKSSVRHHLAGFLEGRIGTLVLSRRCDRVEELASALSDELEIGTSLLVVELGVSEDGMFDMLDFVRPSVAVITGLGPARLDVLGTPDQVDAAVMAPVAVAGTVIVNGADARLAQRATSGGSHPLDVGRVAIEVIASGEWQFRVDGELVATVTAPREEYPGTVACAASAALALGVARESVIARCAHLTPTPSRIASTVTPAGLHVFVDIRGSTPAEGSFAVRTLRECDVSGRKVFVTPGVAQLGSAQGYENFRLGALVAQSGAELVAIARTNAEALIDGYGGPVRRFDTLREAREWTRRTLEADDAVIYFNDLGDHYP